MKATTFFIDPELMKRAKYVALDENTTVSEIIRKLLEEYVKKKENNVKK